MIAPFYTRKNDLEEFKLGSDFRAPNLTVYTKVCFQSRQYCLPGGAAGREGIRRGKRAHGYKLHFDCHTHTITFEIHMHMSALVCVCTHKQIKISINQEVLQLHLNLNV